MAADSGESASVVIDIFLPGTHVHKSDRFSVFVLQAQESIKQLSLLPSIPHPPLPPPPNGNASVSRTARTGGKREVVRTTERVREKERQGRTMCNTFFNIAEGRCS